MPAGDNKWNVVKDGEIVAVASRTADGSLALSDVASERTTVIASGQLSELAETAPSALAVAPAQ